MIEAGWLTAAALVPLYFDVYSSRVFEPDKIISLRSLVLVLLFAQAACFIIERATGHGPSSFSAVWQAARQANPLHLAAFLYCAVYLISTATSISPTVSLWGGYQRLEGTYTLLTYVAVFALVAYNLRRREQLERLVTVMLLTSLPISLYGLVQHFRLDPLPWGGDVIFRVSSTMGNPIFLAAYLILVVPLALIRLLSAIDRLRAAPPTAPAESATALSTAAWSLGAIAVQVVGLGMLVVLNDSVPGLWLAAPGMIALFALLSIRPAGQPLGRIALWMEVLAYSTLLALQGTCVFLTQSRGPQIGLLVGLFLIPVLFLLRGRASGKASAQGLLMGLIGAGVCVAAFLVVFNLPSTPLAPLKQLPYIGRLGQLTEVESGTGRVRVLIWQGSWQLLRTLPPVGFSPDPLGVARLLVGYGPEAMHVAYAKVYPPELGQIESRNASPDRNHNDLLDHLVMTGVLGLAAYLFLLGAASWLGWRILRRAEDFPTRALAAGLLSILAARLAETQFGIAIAATNTYLWLVLAMLIALDRLAAQQSPGVAVGVPLEVAQKVDRKKRGRHNRPVPSLGGRTAPQGVVSIRESVVPIMAYGSLMAAVLVILATSGPVPSQATLVASSAVLLVGVGALAVRLREPGARVETPRRGVSTIDRPALWAYGALTPLALVVAWGIYANISQVSADVEHKRGTQLESLGRRVESVIENQQSVIMAPTQDYYLLYLGRAFFEYARTMPAAQAQNGQSATLKADLDEVLELSPNRIASLSRADALTAGSVALERGRDLAPLNTDQYAYLGRLYALWGQADGDVTKLNKAIDYYRQAIVLSPNTAHLQYEMAQIVLAANQPEEALAIAQHAIEIDPTFAPTHVILGDALQALGRLDEALEAHLQALRMDPSVFLDSRVEQRVTAYIAAGKSDPLASAYAEAAQRQPMSVPVRSVYGFILARTGRVQEAITEFKALISLNPQDWVSYRNLALTYQQSGATDEALAAASSALRLAPTDQQSSLQALVGSLQPKQ